MEEVETLKEEIRLIKERNKRVENDKAWETSNFRKILICILTYLVMSLIMFSIGIKEFYLSAIIPTLGFFLSTQSLPVLKRWWINNNRK